FIIFIIFIILSFNFLLVSETGRLLHLKESIFKIILPTAV
ncbi:MAG: hypothetical protein ACJAT1_001297, partial [Marivirga sp.]